MKQFPWCVLLLPVIACSKPEGDAAAEPDHSAVVAGVSVAPAAAQRFVETADAVGTTVVRSGHTASLAAPAPARVARVLVAPGQQVAAGDALIEFEQPPFEAAVKSADAALVAAEQAAERAKRLADAGVVPRRDAEAAAAELARARTDAQGAHRALELATLRSPIAGVVTRMSAMLGAGVDAGQPLVEVADPTALDVVLLLSNAAAANVKIGQSVSFHPGTDAFATPVATGRVADVSMMLDSATRGVSVRVELAHGVAHVRIGEALFGRIAIAEHAHAVMVPLDALVPDGEGYRVFVVDDEGIAIAREVKVGGRTDHDAWLTDGLKAGERIVTHGAFGVSDSAKVEGGKKS